MSDITQLIKDRLDTVEFLRQYLELKPAGKNFKALCPFHGEKTPSFMVSSERQSWHCFGACNEGGDIIKFLMKYENLEFYEVLKVLAEKAGVDIKTSAGADFRSYNNLYKAMEAAKDFFKSNLFASNAADASQIVNNYLRERGLRQETIKEFELGLALGESDILTRHLLKLGHKIDDIEKAGLTIKTERGTYWDRFRSRIMFPIHNHFGKTVGFTGRILPGKENDRVGKYVNSPETPIYQKSKILYGFYKTKNDIRQLKSVVLVEGQMDFLMMQQDGIKNAVATSGTALTSEHLKVLRRISDELVLSFDNDEAGHKAAEQAIDSAGANDFFVKLLIIDDQKLKDPADVAKNKPGTLQKLIQESKSAMDYYFYKYDTGVDDFKLKNKNIHILLSKIVNLSNHIEQDRWLIKLEEKSGVKGQALRDQAEKIQRLKKEPSSAETISEYKDYKIVGRPLRLEIITQRLLGVLFHKKRLEEAKNYAKYFPEKYAQIYESLVAQNKKDIFGDQSELVDMISLRSSFESQNLDDGKLESELKILFRELKSESLKTQRKKLRELNEKLQRTGDEVGAQKAIQEIDVINKELYNSNLA